MNVTKPLKSLIVIVVALLAAIYVGHNADQQESGSDAISTTNVGSDTADNLAGIERFSAEERSEIERTVALIEGGGPFPYAKDGTTFSNREGLLPRQVSGYYREYTVKTPGSPDRGARRIVAGKNGEIFYTDDHYQSFVRLR